jgi:hypothetical protein
MGYYWTERRPFGDINKAWEHPCCDYDGSTIVATVPGSDLQISVNSGANWGGIEPAADHRSFQVDCTDSGSFIILGEQNTLAQGKLYVSSNYGAGWTQIDPSGWGSTFDWVGVCCDSDASFMMAIAKRILPALARLYLTTDSGANWSETQPAGNVERNWSLLACDSTGTNLIVGEYGISAGSGRLYTSSNSGANWTERQPAGDTDCYWIEAAVSADGSKMFAVASQGRAWKSTDSGANWTEIAPTGIFQDENHQIICCDALGVNLIHAIYSGRVHYSEDSGSNWYETQPAGNIDLAWRGCDMSASGEFVVIDYRNGRLYTGLRGGIIKKVSDVDWYLSTDIHNIMEEDMTSDIRTVAGVAK